MGEAPGIDQIGLHYIVILLNNYFSCFCNNTFTSTTQTAKEPIFCFTFKVTKCLTLSGGPYPAEPL